LTDQVLTPQKSLSEGATGPAELAWSRLLRAASATKRELAAELQDGHGISITAYEALYTLSKAEGQRLKRVTLADRLALTPSGVTRLLEGLEQAGLVERVSCATDLRVSYAQLTDAGRTRLQAASCGHTGSIRALFERHLAPEEVDQLAGLLGKLPGALDEVCPAAAVDAAAADADPAGADAVAAANG